MAAVNDWRLYDWSAWRACTVCLAGLGQPCVSLSGRVVGGHGDGVRTVVAPHNSRRRRTVR